MSSPHRIAVVGVGAIANLHAMAIGDLGGVRLVGGSCRTESKGQKFAEQFGCNWYPDYREMLDREKPDLITICTPSGAHLEPALAAASRGIHVLCEKPLEITTARIDQMINAAKQAGIVLGGLFPQRFNPVLQALHQAARDGRFGNLAVVNSYVPWWRDDDYYGSGRWQGTIALDGGGAMMNQSIHGVDAMQWLARAATDLDDQLNPVSEVCAYTARRGHTEDLIEVEDTAVVILKFRGGALGQLLGTTSMYPGTLKRVQIAGRDGTAEVLEDELITWQFRKQLPEDEATRKRFSAATKTGGGATDPMAIDYSHHTRNIAAFLEAVDDKSPLMLSGLEARKAVAIIEAIYRSARNGRTVAIG